MKGPNSKITEVQWLVRKQSKTTYLKIKAIYLIRRYIWLIWKKYQTQLLLKAWTATHLSCSWTAAASLDLFCGPSSPSRSSWLLWFRVLSIWSLSLLIWGAFSGVLSTPTASIPAQCDSWTWTPSPKSPRSPSNSKCPNMNMLSSLQNLFHRYLLYNHSEFKLSHSPSHQNNSSTFLQSRWISPIYPHFQDPIMSHLDIDCNILLTNWFLLILSS